MRKYFYLSAFAVCFMIAVPAVSAQTVKKVVKATVNHLTALDLNGEWDYEGVDVKFKSDKLLSKAGGAVAAAKIEKDLDAELEKIGFQPGVTKFTFKEDGTFTNTTGGTTLKGKYTYNSDKDEITLRYMNAIPMKAKVAGTGSKMSLMFETKAFLSFVTFLGSHSGVNVVKSVTSLLKTYDGMEVGLEFRKQK